MPYGTYHGRIEIRQCPTCGKERPIDWFVRNHQEHESCWLYRETGRDGGKTRKENGNGLIG